MGKDFISVTEIAGDDVSQEQVDRLCNRYYWASGYCKGKDVLDSYVFKDLDIAENGAPNQNIVVGYVLRTITLPNINPYGVMKTVQALTNQALKNKDKKKEMVSVEDTKKVELKKVPESQLKRPKKKGWVKEDDIIPILKDFIDFNV